MEGWMVGVQEFRSQQSWTRLSFQHVDRFLFQDHKFQYFLFMANFPHWATGACFLRRLCFASPNCRRFHSIHKDDKAKEVRVTVKQTLEGAENCAA
ncbi:hypothetical protein CY35_14G072500 [Sphagnum magellanicum]|nr:hypothetical protein CY35_14G072500 [Sphagnum magellanicum]